MKREKERRFRHFNLSGLTGGIAYLLLIAWGIFSLFPLYWLFVTAFKKPTVILSMPPQMFSYPPTLLNFMTLFGRSQLMIFRWLLNSMIHAGSTTAFCIFFSAMAGYALAKKKFPGDKLIFAIIIGIILIPSQIIIVPLFIIIIRLGWVDTYWALIIPDLVIPASIFLMKQFLQTLPSELIDAARIDGCSEIGIFIRIVLPLAKPGLAVVGIFGFVSEWNSFLWPLIVINSNCMRTIQLGLAYLQSTLLTEYGLLMAGAAFAAIPMFIIFFSFQKYFLRGVTVGALKG